MKERDRARNARGVSATSLCGAARQDPEFPSQGQGHPKQASCVALRTIQTASQAKPTERIRVLASHAATARQLTLPAQIKMSHAMR
jgi:hypothetical protein